MNKKLIQSFCKYFANSPNFISHSRRRVRRSPPNQVILRSFSLFFLTFQELDKTDNRLISPLCSTILNFFFRPSIKNFLRTCDKTYNLLQKRQVILLQSHLDFGEEIPILSSLILVMSDPFYRSVKGILQLFAQEWKHVE